VAVAATGLRVAATLLGTCWPVPSHGLLRAAAFPSLHRQPLVLSPRSPAAAAFLDKHPGGREMLLLSAGRECTALFNSYHCLTDKPRKYMAAYEIGSLTGPGEFPAFAPDTGFYKTLSERVKNYFESTQQDPKAPSRGACLRPAERPRQHGAREAAATYSLTAPPSPLSPPPLSLCHRVLQACCACCPCLRASRWATP
jgi:hypothetical protein